MMCPASRRLSQWQFVFAHGGVRHMCYSSGFFVGAALGSDTVPEQLWEIMSSGISNGPALWGN